MRRPLVLWSGLCPFRENLSKGVDLLTISSLHEADLKVHSCNLFARDLVGLSGRRPDLIVVADGDYGLLVDPDGGEFPTACFLFDPHLHSWAHSYAASFDHALSTQWRFVEEIRRAIPGLATWSPYWADPANTESQTSPLHDREIDVAFVGNLGKPNQARRDAFLSGVRERLGGRYKLHIGPGSWQDIYSRSKIVFNVPVAGDLNMRVFEAMACGAILVSPGEIDGMNRLFDAGRNFFSYSPGDMEGACRRIEEILTKTSDYEPLAARTRTKVLDSHTRTSRGRQVAERVQRICSIRTPGIAPEERTFRMARALIALVLETPTVTVQSWPEWFDRRIDLSIERLRRLSASGYRAPDTALLMGMAHFLQGRLEKAMEEWERACVDGELEPIARYGQSRLLRKMGDVARANQFYPRGLRSGVLPRRARAYWETLLETLQLEVREYVISDSSGAKSAVIRGRAREKRLVLDRLTTAWESPPQA